MRGRNKKLFIMLQTHRNIRHAVINDINPDYMGLKNIKNRLKIEGLLLKTKKIRILIVLKCSIILIIKVFY